MYFFFLWLYFCKEILGAVIRGEKSAYDENISTFSSFHGRFPWHSTNNSLCAFHALHFVYCFLIAEVTVYTLIGCVLILLTRHTSTWFWLENLFMPFTLWSLSCKITTVRSWMR